MKEYKKYVYGLLSTMMFTLSALAAEPATSVTTETSASFFSKERWGISYFNYINGPMFSEATGSSINHYLTLKNKINKDWYVAGVFQPDTNIAEGQSVLSLGDSYLQIGYPNIATFEGGRVFGQVRYFLPISEGSKKANLAGILSTRIYAELEADSWHFTYIFIPKLYLNTSVVDGQKVFSQSHWLQASYDITPSFSLDFALYPGWTYARNGGSTFNDLLAYPGFTAKFSKDLSVSPYVELKLLNIEGKSTSVGASLSYALL